MKVRTTSSQPTPIGTTELGTAFINFFNAEAQEILKNQCDSLIYQYNEVVNDGAYLYNTIELLRLLKVTKDNPATNSYIRKAAAVNFFGVTCKVNEVVPGIHKIVDAVNDMAKNKWLKASLYNLGMLELASDPLTPSTKRFVIFSYLAVDDKYQQDVDKAYGHLKFAEGGIPSEFKK
jgi:hypothetical protein